MRHLQSGLLVPLSLALIAFGCSGSDSAPQDPGGTESALHASSGGRSPGAVGPKDPAYLPFLGDPHQDGQAPALHLVDLSWGRLVDLYALDPATGKRELAYHHLVVGPDVHGDAVNYQLVHDLTQTDQLTILHRRGSPAFKSALQNAERTRLPIQDKGLPPDLPLWSMVGRNAAISMQFDDLLDEATVTAENVRLFTGYPPIVPFEVRVLADQNHGGIADPEGDGSVDFYTTRVIIDLTVSELDSILSNPPVPVNGTGLPEAITADAPNGVLRIPTRPDPSVGQLEILRNPIGRGLAFNGNGNNDPTSPTLDILRAFRSGGSTASLGDAYRGFLPDDVAPLPISSQGVVLSGTILPDPAVAGGFIIQQVGFNVARCTASGAQPFLIEQSGLLALSYDNGSSSGSTLHDVKVRVLFPAGSQPAAGQAWTSAGYVPGDDPLCYFDYTPDPAVEPNRGLSPDAHVTVRFDEAIAAASVRALEDLTIASVASSPDAHELVVGPVAIDATATRFELRPLVPLDHVSGTAERWYTTLRDGGAEDLAGNAFDSGLAADLQGDFFVDASASTLRTSNLALRFDSVDMIGGDGLPELRGQFLYDLANGAIIVRPISRFDGTVDRTKPLPAVMVPFPAGMQVPLVPLGAKLHQVWRYADMGFSLTDETNTNLDIEGISWSPVGGAVITDLYDEFSITLAHSGLLPDEYLDPMSGFPRYPNSGLKKVYADNYLDSGAIVHSKERGYTVSPADLYVSTTGTPMLPYPLNRDLAPEDHSYYTWRDTALQALGGAGGSGAPFDQEITVLGLGPDKTYPAGMVPSIGLPLLLEFRCYPTDFALGLNAFDVSLAANSSARPNFRAFSAGGYDTTGSPVIKHPDLEDVADGGFNPNSNPPGQPTMGIENTFYLGELELVTRISRAHTIWLDTATGAPSFAEPLISADLPPGTQIELAYRGATSIIGGSPGQPLYIGSDGFGLDAYGDPIDDPATGAPLFLNLDPTWKEAISEVDGAQHLQVRLTFVGNAATNEIARASGLGFAWFD